MKKPIKMSGPIFLAILNFSNYLGIDSFIYSSKCIHQAPSTISSTALHAESTFGELGLSRKYPAMYYKKETFIEEDTRYKKHCT